eukprot:jgi/Tetstr1/447862/TSEL_035172.t1
MAARGGGRGGWRGRGRGGAGGGPVARDDDGNIVAVEVAGPPPLFPDGVRLPERPTATAKDERLMSRRHALLDFYRAPQSPYHLSMPKRKAEGVEQAIERYGDKYRGAGPNKRPALSKALFLHPKYFPPELYSAKQQRHSAHGTGTGKAAAFVMDQSSSKQGFSRLEQLAKLESKQEADGDGAGKAGGGGPGGAAAEDDDDAPLEEEYEEEDDYIEDDDYYQGNHFDDDDGYDDGYDDGDDGAIF